MRGASTRILRGVVASLAIALFAACGGDDDDGGSGRDPNVETPPLITVVPQATRGVLAVDFAGLLSGPAATEIAKLLDGNGADEALGSPFETIQRYMLDADIATSIESAILADPVDPTDGKLLVAKVVDRVLALDDIFGSSRLDRVEGIRGQEIYADPDSGRMFTLLRDGRLLIGREAGMRAALATLDGNDPGVQAGAIGPDLTSLDTTAPFSFVYGLPALYREIDPPGPGAVSLRRAEAVSGAIWFDAETFAGGVALHSDNAETFVERFNRLVAGIDTPALRVGDTGAIEVDIPATAYDRTPEEIVASRALLKQLTHGMDAVDYTDGVIHGGNVPWLNFDVGGDPNSIFINFEFIDQTAIARFEADELPAGFKLAPIRIFESDEPTYFLVLNVYNSSGGLVEGARAEWSVFVEDPEGGHPRFLVVQAAAASISADSVNLLTDPEPVSHELDDGRIVSYVGVEDPDTDEVSHYFTSSIVWPQQPEDREGFAREFVAANDYIYWGNGVSDRTLYNASVHNRDGVRIPDSDIEIADDSRWARYVAARPKHTYVYLNPLDIVISPWWNLDADYLDVNDDFRGELIAFKNNFYPFTVRGMAEAAVAGDGDVLAAFTAGASAPTAHFNFRIVDPQGLANILDLPNDSELAKVRILEGDVDEDYYLSLRVYQLTGALDGLRAEWGVYTAEAGGRPRVTVLDVLTDDAVVDPVRALLLPDVVEHGSSEDRMMTTLVSDDIAFQVEVDLASSESALPTLDWVETADQVCRLNGVCSKFFYDGMTMETPVLAASSSAVDISRLSTPWDEFIASEPTSVLLRSDAQASAWNPWVNVSP